MLWECIPLDYPLGPVQLYHSMSCVCVRVSVFVCVCVWLDTTQNMKFFTCGKSQSSPVLIIMMCVHRLMDVCRAPSDLTCNLALLLNQIKICNGVGDTGKLETWNNCSFASSGLSVSQRWVMMHWILGYTTSKGLEQQWQTFSYRSGVGSNVNKLFSPLT